MTYPSWPSIRSSNFVRHREVGMLEADTPCFMGQPVAACADDLAGADFVVIGSPYVASWGDYGGASKTEWMAGPKRVRQQSLRYQSGYIVDLDVEVFEHLRLVDYGDADIPAEAATNPTVRNVLRAQCAVERKVEEALDAGAVPIILGQNSPCATYAVARPMAERTGGRMGMVSLDAHWDAGGIDRLTMDPRIAGSGNWKRKLYDEFASTLTPRHLVDIGERGMLENAENVRGFTRAGAHYVSGWELRGAGGLETATRALAHAYDDTSEVYFHADLDVLGSGDAFEDLAEPMGMTEYELVRLAYEVGRRGVGGVSFVCIPPGSPVVHRTVSYAIALLMAGVIEARAGSASQRGNEAARPGRSDGRPKPTSPATVKLS